MGCDCLAEAEDDRSDPRNSVSPGPVLSQQVSHQMVKVVRFGWGPWEVEVTYAYDEGIPRWEMRLPNVVIWPDNVLLLEAAIHELRRLNGTLPPVRMGGLRPAKGGE